MKSKQIDFGEFTSEICKHNIAYIQCRECLPLENIKYDIPIKLWLLHPIQMHKMKKHFKRSAEL